MTKDDLVRNLALLAQAGLQGMVTETLRLEINGKPVDVEGAVQAPNPQLLRPPTGPPGGGSLAQGEEPRSGA